MTIGTISKSWTEVPWICLGADQRWEPAEAAGSPGSSLSLPSRRAKGGRRQQVSPNRGSPGPPGPAEPQHPAPPPLPQLSRGRGSFFTCMFSHIYVSCLCLCFPHVCVYGYVPRVLHVCFHVYDFTCEFLTCIFFPPALLAVLSRTGPDSTGSCGMQKETPTGFQTHGTPPSPPALPTRS